ncbi:MAG: hypothetical protein PUF08_02235, partial [Clostridiales bacterium]|nr:hypothetical protein [Clostridiales bacterium]
MDEGLYTNSLEERRTGQTITRGRGAIETRTLEILVNDSKFEKLATFVGNEISQRVYDTLEQRYVGDERLDLYSLSEVATYDMLTNPDNELRSLFADNIAEYFGASNLNTDIAGNIVSDENLKRLTNSVVRNENGQLIPVYHATDKSYVKLRAGDIGIHFGSYAQATQRANDKGISNPTYIQAYLNITNPLVVDGDFTNWNAPQLAKELERMGVLTRDEALSFIKNGISAGSNAKLIEILKSKGYDGISYTNEYEAGAGTSYIVFDYSQIIRMDLTGDDTRSVDQYNKSDNSQTRLTSINEKNMPVSTENTPVNEDVTDTDVNYAEGEILSLKHTKNIYSVFKNAARMVVGKDVITDGFFAVPLSDEALAEVKKVYTGNIENNNNIELSKFYHSDNDVVIQGNPKIADGD